MAQPRMMHDAGNGWPHPENENCHRYGCTPVEETTVPTTKSEDRVKIEINFDSNNYLWGYKVSTEDGEIVEVNHSLSSKEIAQEFAEVDAKRYLAQSKSLAYWLREDGTREDIDHS